MVCPFHPYNTMEAIMFNAVMLCVLLDGVPALPCIPFVDMESCLKAESTLATAYIVASTCNYLHGVKV